MLDAFFVVLFYIHRIYQKIQVRQNYIRRRLLTTYKAIERLSQSEFNLDRLEVAPQTARASLEPQIVAGWPPPHHFNNFCVIFSVQVQPG